ncbi:helix-turn-helix transcriptional regulator [Vibrio sp. S4M6]|uniref:helix-turn-helix transcriptional regulator n=1 Tax=Vibrio sinus TaxID=2946865 RepID=UPI002029E5CB|nr:helix-turn-helix transcriptional regulator [Vibrio sinus]MCL9780223.1 helix-turn-helix transcriptional regulator [Vibrio sinus]
MFSSIDKSLYQVTRFRAEQLQKLRNVKAHSPSIIQVLSGSKKLYWHDNSMIISNTSLLLCGAATSLNFENQPHNGYFSSKVFSFFCQPTEALLSLSQSILTKNTVPIIKSDKALLNMLNALSELGKSDLSGETQTFLLMALYQHLAEKGVLHYLFASNQLTLSQKVSHYLSFSPAKPHTLTSIAATFAMSRATFIRHLNKEDIQFRELLTDVRLNHALNLMQKEKMPVSILAQLCGYQSESRFSQRFKAKFGVTPREYMNTLKD